jgi:C1A family cysteine protease
MRKDLIAASLIAIAIITAYYTSAQAKTDNFELWKGKFGVSWAPHEEPYRRLIFERNLAQIEKHNSNNAETYKKGINQFTIYTAEEFETIFLTPMPLFGAPQLDEVMGETNDIDWTTQGKVTPVKNQRSCGSCWAFSATGVIESFFLVKKSQTLDLSEQQLVDCSRPQGNQGCNGGWPTSAVKYVISNGLTSTAAYPYTAKDGSCKTQGGETKITGQKAASGCSGLTTAITSSPISVTVDATNWSQYKSGVFNNCKSSINHAVLLVGVKDGNWKIKNSWGSTWGETGYIRLAGGNTCGLCQYAGVTIV